MWTATNCYTKAEVQVTVHPCQDTGSHNNVSPQAVFSQLLGHNNKTKKIQRESREASVLLRTPEFPCREVHKVRSPDFLPATKISCHLEAVSLTGGCSSLVSSRGDRTQAHLLAVPSDETQSQNHLGPWPQKLCYNKCWLLIVLLSLGTFCPQW